MKKVSVFLIIFTLYHIAKSFMGFENAVILGLASLLTDTMFKKDDYA